MNLLRKREPEPVPEVKRDFSHIAETYGYTPKSELEPGQEITIHQGLGLTALRDTKFNPDHQRLAELWTGEIGPDSNTKLHSQS